MSHDIASLLAEPFDKKLLKTNKAKRGLTYIPISEVVARLNRVFGWNGWSYEVVRMWEAGEQETRTGVYPVWCMAHVRVSVPVPALEMVTVHDGVGGQQVKALTSGEGVVDLGDEYKGAVSDALKKAAQHFGVGLDLARGEDAMAWEADQSDDIDCPLCGASIAGAKSDREPMRSHLVEIHEYVRSPAGTVAKKVNSGDSSPGTSPEADTVTSAANPAREGRASVPLPASKPALGAVKKAAK